MDDNNYDGGSGSVEKLWTYTPASFTRRQEKNWWIIFSIVEIQKVK